MVRGVFPLGWRLVVAAMSGLYTFHHSLAQKAENIVTREIIALENGAMERWRQGDPDGFLEISAPEVTCFDSGTPRRLDGLAALKAEYEPRAGRIHFDVMEFIDPVVQVHGDAAVLFYRFFSTDLNPDGTVAGRTPWNCTAVYARQDGQWRIVHTHWSYIRGERKQKKYTPAILPYRHFPVDQAGCLKPACPGYHQINQLNLFCFSE